MELEAGDLVMCTVDRVVGTVVFVKMLLDGKEVEGSIVTSEIAPGRIRNLRDYVVPKKRIVCKVLRINSNGNIELSLRRVTQKEKKEMLEQEKQEKSYMGILKSVVGEKAEEVFGKIKEKEKVSDFFLKAKDNSELFEKLIGKKDAEKITEILKSQKQKKTEIKKEIHLTTTAPDGILLIKEILSNIKGVEIKYLSAGRYSFRVFSENPKTADNMLKEAFSRIEKEAKKKSMEFSVK